MSSTTMIKRNYFLTSKHGDSLPTNDENNVNKCKRRKNNNNDENESKENVSTDRKWKKRKRNENESVCEHHNESKLQLLFNEGSKKMEGTIEILKYAPLNENDAMKDEIKEISKRNTFETNKDNVNVKDISRTLETFNFVNKESSRTKSLETIQDKFVPDVIEDMNVQSSTKPVDICKYTVCNAADVSFKSNKSDHRTPMSSSSCDQTRSLEKTSRTKLFVPNVFEPMKHEPIPESYTKAIQKLNTLQSNAKELKTIERNRNNPSRQKEIHEVLKYLARLNVTVDDIRKLNVIHVSGTKGKGSTSAYCESILRSHGYRTGFYSSPHLIEVRERIKLNGQPIGYDLFTKYFWHVYNRLYSQRSDETDMPAYFRFLTVMSFYVFLNENIDVSIFEVGIGGLYDSTNIVPNTKIAGITSLGFDHTAVLGNTIEEIAMQKAGIMKPNCICVTSINQRKETIPILMNKARDLKCVLLEAPNILHYDWNGYEMDEDWTNTFQSINISLAIQLAYLWIYKMNKATDVKQMVDKYFKSLNINVQTNSNEVVHEEICNPNEQETLGQKSNESLLVGPRFKITKEVYRGLKSCVWPGRIQIVYKNNFKYFLDGAHTSDSIAYCASWFQQKSKVEESKLMNGSSNLFGSTNRSESCNLFGANTGNLRNKKNDAYWINQSENIANNLKSIQFNKTIISDRDNLNTTKETLKEIVQVRNDLRVQTTCSKNQYNLDNSRLKALESYEHKNHYVHNENPVGSVQTGFSNMDIRIKDSTNKEINSLNEQKNKIVSETRSNCSPKVKRILVFNVTGERDSSKLLPPLVKCDFDYILITPNILSNNPDTQYGNNNSSSINDKDQTVANGLKSKKNVPDKRETSKNEMFVNNYGKVNTLNENDADKNESQPNAFKDNIKDIKTGSDIYFGNKVYSSQDGKYSERLLKVNANVDNAKKDQSKTFKDTIGAIKTNSGSSCHNTSQFGNVLSQSTSGFIGIKNVTAADAINLTSSASDKLTSVRNIVNVANSLNQSEHCRVLLMNNVLGTYNFLRELDPSQEYHVLVTGSLHLVGAFLNVLSTH